jgi:hypothetical protein
LISLLHEPSLGHYLFCSSQAHHRDPYAQGQIRIEMDLQAPMELLSTDAIQPSCMCSSKPLRNCSFPAFHLCMKIIAPDIVLGLQEQERKCGSEAVQIHPDSRTGVTATRVRLHMQCLSVRLISHRKHHLCVGMSSLIQCITPGLKARAGQSRAEKNLSDSPII